MEVNCDSHILYIFHPETTCILKSQALLLTAKSCLQGGSDGQQALKRYADTVRSRHGTSDVLDAEPRHVGEGQPRRQLGAEGSPKGAEGRARENRGLPQRAGSKVDQEQDSPSDEVRPRRRIRAAATG